MFNLFPKLNLLFRKFYGLFQGTYGIHKYGRQTAAFGQLKKNRGQFSVKN